MSKDAKHVIDRASLRFADEVAANFAFLKILGFRCKRSHATSVIYKSPKLAVDVYHDSRSYEIGLQIKSSGRADAYPFSEIIRLLSSQQAEQYRDYASYTIEGVAEGVGQLAKLFREYINIGILNNSELFSRLKRQREEWAKGYAFETHLKQALEKCESAWADKEFRKVVQMLTPLQEHLNPTDLKKLAYAKKHSSATT